MYTLRVSQDFIAQHYLTVPDCGPENEWHSHHFEVEVLLKGDTLNENGYLIDIVEVEEALTNLSERYRNATLNDLPEFEGLNPSIEHFSRIICQSIEDEIMTDNLDEIAVRVWEDDVAWAGYSM